jgi:hypothetical protein
VVKPDQHLIVGKRSRAIGFSQPHDERAAALELPPEIRRLPADEECLEPPGAGEVA